MSELLPIYLKRLHSLILKIKQNILISKKLIKKMGTDTNPDVEILGQKLWLPNSKFKLIAFIILVVSLTVIALSIICNKYSWTKTKDGWSLFQSFKIENDEIIKKKGFVIGFWTPCNETEKYLTLTNNNQKDLYIWQTNAGHSKPIDTLNIEFGKRLQTELNFNGYRRSKVFGKGDNVLKEGWWWSIGFEGTCDEEFLKKFKNLYIDFWCPKNRGTKWDNLYIEVLGKSKT